MYLSFINMILDMRRFLPARHRCILINNDLSYQDLMNYIDNLLFSCIYYISIWFPICASSRHLCILINYALIYHDLIDYIYHLSLSCIHHLSIWFPICVGPCQPDIAASLSIMLWLLLHYCFLQHLFSSALYPCQLFKKIF